MVFGSVGTNLSRLYAEGVGGLPGISRSCKLPGRISWRSGPRTSGLSWGGSLDTARLRVVGEQLLEADLAYTVHAPLEINLMDLTSHDLQRDVLDASLRFAHAIGAEVVVCHAGQRVGARDARNSMRDQLSAERSALREAGDLAAELGVTIAVENYYPEQPILRGAVYDYSVWPSQLAEQISRSTIPRSASAWMRACGPRGSRLRLRLYRGVHRPGTTRAPRTPSRQPAEDQPYGRARRLRSTPCTGWEICTSRRAGAPSRSGTCCSG